MDRQDAWWTTVSPGCARSAATKAASGPISLVAGLRSQRRDQGGLGTDLADLDDRIDRNAKTLGRGSDRLGTYCFIEAERLSLVGAEERK